MDLVTTLLLAVGLAMDAFAVSVACGLAFDRRRHLHALRIALSFGGFQALMPAIGWLAGVAVRDAIERFDHWIAFGLLAFIGVHMILEAVRSHREGTAMDLPDPLRLLALSIATSVDALAAGLTLSVLRVPILAPAATIGVVTFAVSYAGIVLGHELEALLRGRARRDIQVAGGIALIAIGARVLFQHLASGT